MLRDEAWPRLHAGHAPAVLAFELANRAYFAASVSDCGGEFFDRFTDRHNASLAEQEARPQRGRPTPGLRQMHLRTAGRG